MVARLHLATIHRAAIRDGLAERVAVACALLLPLLVAWAAIRGWRTNLVPLPIVKDIPATSYRLTPGTPVVSAGLFMNGVAGAGLVDWVASLLVACVPIRIAVLAVRCHPAVLLICAAGDRTRLSLLLAPAVAPLIRALVLPVRVAGAASRWPRSIHGPSSSACPFHRSRRRSSTAQCCFSTVDRLHRRGPSSSWRRSLCTSPRCPCKTRREGRSSQCSSILLTLLVAPAVTLLLPLLVTLAAFVIA